MSSIRFNNTGERVFNHPTASTPGTSGAKGRGIVFRNPNPVLSNNCLPPPIFYGLSFQSVPVGTKGGDPRFTGVPNSSQAFNNGSFQKNNSAGIADRAFFNNPSVSRKLLNNNFSFLQNYQLADFFYGPNARSTYARNPAPVGNLPNIYLRDASLPCDPFETWPDDVTDPYRYNMWPAYLKDPVPTPECNRGAFRGPYPGDPYADPTRYRVRGPAPDALPAPGTCAPPAPVYGGPGPAYGGPDDGDCGGPDGDYGGPPPGYGGPPPGYGGPPPLYRRSGPSCGSPGPDYGSPPPGYRRSGPGCGIPSAAYALPPPGYGLPNPIYGVPPPPPPPPPYASPLSYSLPAPGPVAAPGGQPYLYPNCSAFNNCPARFCDPVRCRECVMRNGGSAACADKLCG